MARPLDRSAQRLEDAHDGSHGRGLAGSIPTYQPHDLAPIDGKRKLVYCNPVAEALVEVRDLKHDAWIMNLPPIIAVRAHNARVTSHVRIAALRRAFLTPSVRNSGRSRTSGARLPEVHQLPSRLRRFGGIAASSNPSTAERTALAAAPRSWSIRAATAAPS